MSTAMLSEAVEARLARNAKKLEKLKNIVSQTEYKASDMPPRDHDSDEIAIQLSVHKALELLESNIFEWQRDVSSPRLVELTTKIKDGRFIKAVIAVARYQGDAFMMNGQHVTLATILANLKRGPDVDIIYFDCETAEQVACLWNQFDTGNSRTARQMAASYVGVLGSDWTAESVAMFSSASAMLDYGVAMSYKSSITKEDRIKLLMSNLETASVARDLVYLNGEKVSHIAKAPIIAVMMDNVRENREKAIEFWTYVATGLGISDPNHPAYRLKNYLEKTTRSFQTAGKDKTSRSSTEINDTCRSAWLAFRDNRTIASLKRTSMKSKRNKQVRPHKDEVEADY